MSAAEKLVMPERMESHSLRRALARPYCALHELDPEEHLMCDPLQEEETRLLVRSDPETFKLHVEFVHAHGIPKGQVTNFSNTCAVAAQWADRTGEPERAASE